VKVKVHSTSAGPSHRQVQSPFTAAACGRMRGSLNQDSMILMRTKTFSTLMHAYFRSLQYLGWPKTVFFMNKIAVAILALHIVCCVIVI